MIHLFLNGSAASAGGGLTYLRNVIPQLAKLPGVKATLAISPLLAKELGTYANITFLEVEVPKSAALRFWWEQTDLPALVQSFKADVLIAAGNFAVRSSPVPQILLSRNSLYTSTEFTRDLWNRGEYAMLIDTRVKAALAKQSVKWADRTIAPTLAFAHELHRWTSENVQAIHHGFDREMFFGDELALPPDVEQKLNGAEDCLKLLFVSHYNYYRNFETLLRSLPKIQEKLRGRKVKLFLTCNFRDVQNPGSYRTRGASTLVDDLRISENVVELGALPYRSLHHLYKACDIYVTPAYAETFAHPLVEAMASELPVVASDLPVHREICEDAALYFATFSPDELAQGILTLASTPELVRRAKEIGRARSDNFSWTKHVEQLMAEVESLLACA